MLQSNLNSYLYPARQKWQSNLSSYVYPACRNVKKQLEQLPLPRPPKVTKQLEQLPLPHPPKNNKQLEQLGLPRPPKNAKQLEQLCLLRPPEVSKSVVWLSVASFHGMAAFTALHPPVKHNSRTRVLCSWVPWQALCHCKSFHWKLELMLQACSATNSTSHGPQSFRWSKGSYPSLKSPFMHLGVPSPC